MWFGVPIALYLAYALFRMFEYYTLKNFQLLLSQGETADNRTALRISKAVLLPARIAGWAMVFWVFAKVGAVGVAALLVIAFPLSLLMQSTVGLGLMFLLGGAAGLTFLIAVPVMVVLIAGIISTI